MEINMINEINSLAMPNIYLGSPDPVHAAGGRGRSPGLRAAQR